MLTKTLKFDDDVLSVLRNMEWNDTGTLGKITGGQLPRDLYVKVNKALEAMGGKWNRKQGGHVFPIDPRQSVEGLLANGTLQVERDGFFETPSAVVDRMLELVALGEDILEPSAGLGAIADRLPPFYRQLICAEKNERRAEALAKKGYFVQCLDFLMWEPDGFRPDTIYMNPPFEEGQDIDHVRHAYDVLSTGGNLVSVMAEGPFFRADKKSVQFREWLHRIGGISEKLPLDSFKESGTGASTRLVVIRKI